jgi:hypothetical protein
MNELSEKEYDEIDEYFTNNNPKVGPNGSGFVSQFRARELGLDSLSMDYLVTKSLSSKRSVSQLMNEIIHQKIAETV